MKSKSKNLLGAIGVIAASIIGTAATAQSSASVAFAGELDSFNRDQWRYVEKYVELFNPTNPKNPFLGKSYSELSVHEFKQIPKSGNVIFELIIRDYAAERDVGERSGRMHVDSIRPTSMSREQFLHVLLREAAKRGVLENALPFLDGSTASFDTGSLGQPQKLPAQFVIISRPLDALPAQRVTASVLAKDAAYRDLAVFIIQNRLRRPRWTVKLERDVAAQIGDDKGTTLVSLPTDTHAFIAGYIAGSNPQFYNGRQPGQAIGPLPLTLGFNNAFSEAQVREAYCSIIPVILQRHRSSDENLNMAASAGFLMAREDARDNFASNEHRLGFNGTLCPATPLVWNLTTMGPAITGIDLLPEQAGTRR